MRNGFSGNIVSIRTVEDCIRATHKYTEGIGTMWKKHPVQGESFPSKVFCKFYEVYPRIELSWDMPAGQALDWIWGETPMIEVTFRYDYRYNKATVFVRDGHSALKMLKRSIPGFSKALENITTGTDDD